MLRATKHLMSEADALNLKESDAEVSFVGRSNAGKSTLINALCEKTELARVSQVPGKTRTVNVYEVKPYRWIVDLPGYGFAIGSKSDKARLGPMIEGYLSSRPNLRMVFVIIDGDVGPTKLDILMINWLIHYTYPFRIIANKIDKLNVTELEKRKIKIPRQLAIKPSDIFWVSSRKNLGIEDLRKMIIELLDAGKKSSGISSQK